MMGSRMRRNVMLVAALAVSLAGCGGVFSAHSDAAATAAGEVLTPERLAAIMTEAKGARMDPTTAQFVANLWVDFTLFAQSVASDQLTTDSALVAEAMWPALAEARATRWHDSLLSRNAPVTQAAVDSAYNADQMRVIQHLLIKADSAAPAAEKAAARKRADDLLARIRGGADFSAVAAANSQDEGSVADSGFMPPAPKGQFVPAFDKVAWALKPGEISGIVTTGFGYHIIRRPTAAQAASRWRSTLAQAAAPRVDSIHLAELDSAMQLQVVPEVGPKIRSAMGDMDARRNDKTKLVTYKGGAFTVGDLIRWMAAASNDPMQGQQRIEQVKQAPDSVLTPFVKQVTQMWLFLKEAEEHHAGMTAPEWSALREGFREEVDSMKSAFELTPDVLKPGLGKAERRKLAQQKVDQYFDRLVKNEVRFRVLPGMLAWTLRGREKFSVDPAGIQRAVDLAKARRAADSTAQVAPPPITPAPSGPPVGGDTSKRAPLSKDSSTSR